MDLAVYQDLFVNFEGFGQSFSTAVQAAVDAWTQGFGLFGDGGAAADAGAEVEANGLSSQFNELSSGSQDAGEPAADAGLNLEVDAGLNL